MGHYGLLFLSLPWTSSVPRMQSPISLAPTALLSWHLGHSGRCPLLVMLVVVPGEEMGKELGRMQTGPTRERDEGRTFWFRADSWGQRLLLGGTSLEM